MEDQDQKTEAVVVPKPERKQRLTKTRSKYASPSNAGAPTFLTDDVLLRIRESVLKGGWLKEIAKETGIKFATVKFWYYTDYQNMRVQLDSWKHERMLKKAEKNIEEILAMKAEGYRYNKAGKRIKAVNGKVLEVKNDMTKFVSKTLGKKFYSEKPDDGGNGNAPITLNLINNYYGNNDPLPVSAQVIPDPALQQNSGGGEESLPFMASEGRKRQGDDQLDG